MAIVQIENNQQNWYMYWNKDTPLKTQENIKLIYDKIYKIQNNNTKRKPNAQK